MYSLIKISFATGHIANEHQMEAEQRKTATEVNYKNYRFELYLSIIAINQRDTINIIIIKIVQVCRRHLWVSFLFLKPLL